MTTLVTSVGRDLAPDLKTLMGPGWFAQFDPASEVSQAAKRSLQRIQSIRRVITWTYRLQLPSLVFTSPMPIHKQAFSLTFDIFHCECKLWNQ
ncbi:unnamed protein product [Trifolium pratense]|uniref:Uncharacterized protein n=1 Tax=Trifolium pratense TaxID=57577 RepID=A0ACB0K888_TRIPR|nr:unnamed protein product [Trifolium pratense]